MTTFAALLVSAVSFGGTPQGVVYDFSATWCGPCQQMRPIVSRLERQGYPIRQVDVDREPALASRFRISSIPAFVLVINGREVSRVVGMTTEGQLKRMMASIPRAAAPSKSPPSKSPRTGRTAPIPVQLAENKTRSKPRFHFPFLGKKKSKSKSKVIEPLRRGSQPPVPRRSAVAARSHSSNPRQIALAASTRIRVRDASGINFGSGTVIASQPGRAIILTCGHILRGLRKDSVIEVDLFDTSGRRTATLAGKPINADFTADVGLISIASPNTLPISKVAGTTGFVSRGERVLNIGCSGGEKPTQQIQQVTALNRYRGPDNIECTGLPIQGRSGGGLFNASGEVVGVCIAADPQDHRGLYAGTRAIHQLLNRAQLAKLYQHSSQPAKHPRATVTLASASAGSRGHAATVESSATVSGSLPAETTADAAMADAVSTSAASLAGTEDAEVICIIRRRNDPQGTSRVVIINRASPKFVAFLTDEQDRQRPSKTAARSRNHSGMSPTSRRVRRAKSRFRAPSVDRSLTATRHMARRPIARRSTWQKSIAATASTTVVDSPNRPTTTTAGPRRYRRSAASR